MKLSFDRVIYKTAFAIHRASSWAYRKTGRTIFVTICNEAFGIGSDAANRALIKLQGQQ